MTLSFRRTLPLSLSLSVSLRASARSVAALEELHRGVADHDVDRLPEALEHVLLHVRLGIIIHVSFDLV